MGMLISGPAWAQSTLPGYTDGPQTMRVDVTTGQIDTIGGVIYSQIKSHAPSVSSE